MITILIAYLLISLLCAGVIFLINMYDKWKYGECIELEDGSFVYSKSIKKHNWIITNRAMPKGPGYYGLRSATALKG